MAKVFTVQCCSGDAFRSSFSTALLILAVAADAMMSGIKPGSGVV